MLPSIFGENLFDDFFSDPFEMMMPQSRNPLYGKHAKNLMKTDVRETENSFEVDMDLPGFKKDEVNLELKDGYLTVWQTKPSTRTKRTTRVVTSGRSAGAARAAEASMSARTSSPRMSMQSLKTASCGCLFRSRSRSSFRPAPQF